MLIRSLLVVGFLLIIRCCLFAQDDYVDVLDTREGATYYGEIIHLEPNEFISFRLQDGQELTLGYNEIRRIRFKKLESSTPELRVKAQEEPLTLAAGPLRRTTHIFSISFTAGRGQRDDFFFGNRNDVTAGYAVQYHLGYKISDRLTTGIGAGYTVYHQDRGERTLDATALGRVDLLKSKLVPFLQMEGGYALPIGSRDMPLIEREGGLLIYPSLGLKLGRRPGQNQFSFDLGYRFLKTQISVANPQGFEQRRTNYRRFSLRMYMSL
ncbi:MAG: hypothetical protein AAFU67_00730 [Bacteroidota bacterium]